MVDASNIITDVEDEARVDTAHQLVELIDCRPEVVNFLALLGAHHPRVVDENHMLQAPMPAGCLVPEDHLDLDEHRAGQEAALRPSMSACCVDRRGARRARRWPRGRVGAAPRPGRELNRHVAPARARTLVRARRTWP